MTNLVAAVTGMVTAVGVAQLPSARLDSVYPPGVAPGGSVEVALAGADLDGLERLEFSCGGLGAELVPVDVDGHGVPVARGVPRFRVTADASVSAGVYEVAAVGRFGRSNAKPFVVGMGGDRSDGDGGGALSVPDALYGQADDNGIDRFKVALAAGDEVGVRCVAGVLDSKMEPVIEVWGPGSEKVAVAGGSGGGEAALGFVAGREGEYELRVYDLLFEGGDAYAYRLELLDQPPVVEVAPPLGTAGSVARFEAACSAGASRTCELAVSRLEPPRAGLEPWLGGEAAAVGGGLVLREVGEDPMPVVSATMAGAWDDAPLLGFPGLGAGRLGPGGEGRFALELPAGGVCTIEVVCDRLGHSADPTLTVFELTRDGEGGEVVPKQVAQNDDGVPGPAGREVRWLSRDPVVTFRSEAGGRYGVRVGNQFGGVSGPVPYLVEAAPPEPGFDVFAAVATGLPEDRKIEPQTAFLRRGGATAIEVVVHRRDGFDGEIELAVEGLPEGTAAGQALVAAGERVASVIVRHNGGDAVPAGAWDGVVQVVATAEIGGERVRRRAVAAVPRWGVNDWNQEAVTVRGSYGLGISLAAAEVSPFAVGGLPPAAAVASGAKLEIPLKLELAGEIKGEVTATLAGVPGMGQPPSVKLSAESPEAVLVVDAAVTDQNKLRAGRSMPYLRIQGTASGYRANPDEVALWEAEKKRLEAVEGADESRARVEEFLKQANERSKPADRNCVTYAGPFELTITDPPQPEGQGDQGS